jgi:hypothetical protein
MIYDKATKQRPNLQNVFSPASILIRSSRVDMFRHFVFSMQIIIFKHWSHPRKQPMIYVKQCKYYSMQGIVLFKLRGSSNMSLGTMQVT